jgi:predicted ATPase
LDGVPLAIELAAARVNHLSFSGLRHRLEQRLPLLTGSRLDLPPRHRTMREAIAWSHDLLETDQQLLFRYIGISPGGCRADALDILELDMDSEPGDQAARIATLDRVAALVDQSLLRREVDPDGESRYVMLETIREYELEQCERAGDRDTAERWRARDVFGLAERLEFAPIVAGSEPSLALFEREQANIRANLEWVRNSGRSDLALGIAARLALLWVAQGQFHDGLDVLEPLLAGPQAGTVPDRARGLTGLGY